MQQSATRTTNRVAEAQARRRHPRPDRLSRRTARDDPNRS
jgi:hypothetical protein